MYIACIWLFYTWHVRATSHPSATVNRSTGRSRYVATDRAGSVAVDCFTKSIFLWFGSKKNS